MHRELASNSQQKQTPWEDVVAPRVVFLLLVGHQKRSGGSPCDIERASVPPLQSDFCRDESGRQSASLAEPLFVLLQRSLLHDPDSQLPVPDGQPSMQRKSLLIDLQVHRAPDGFAG